MAWDKKASEDSVLPTPSQVLERYVQFERILEHEAASEVLNRTLSHGTVHSNQSALVERTTNARFETPTSEFRDIGRGSCGSIFEMHGTAHAIKKGSNVDSIWNDFNLTNRAYNSCVASTNLLKYAFSGLRIPHVPSAEMFNSPESEEWWNINLLRFPPDDRTRAAVFYLDRIFPVTEVSRFALVNKFFHRDAQHAVLGNMENEDCLIRLYFGQTNPGDLYSSDTTLRNFPLYLDQAREINLDISKYSQEMALGLAILHWEAQIDGQDTEFVIGTSTNKVFAHEYSNHRTMPPPMSTMENFPGRETQLWMLDYDKCAEISFDTPDLVSDVVGKYLVAVTGNDPYFPHPCLDIDLWQSFRQVYLKASWIIIKNRNLQQEIRNLPEVLIQEWELWGRQDLEAAEEDSDPFERDEADSHGDDDVEDEDGSDGEDDSGSGDNGGDEN